ncbi:hypothetical protein [Enterovibrio nigricans]|uniref:Uncharacterized protein n=1 Tax=Enterovibrio nigricans DSM 22720 TaxID=1121868 RepID=A0A1T4UWK1_9GAMM|nr:hypothetical protein [Enterovibrio nigricans]SKA57026.1 hypothetical protein SAMN02745132_02686 [Enterovibrio nigricans DSM 22720]
MRPITVRPIRVTRTPARMRATSFAPRFKAKTVQDTTPDLTLIRPAALNTPPPEGEAA